MTDLRPVAFARRLRISLSFLFFSSASMTEQWSEEPTGGAAARLPPNARSAQVGIGAEATACPPAAKSLRVTAESGTVQSGRGGGSRAPSSKLDSLSSPSCALKAADFSSSIELDHFISVHMRRGPFSSFYACISKSFDKIFMFFKGQNCNFSQKSQTNASLYLCSLEDLKWWCKHLFCSVVSKHPSPHKIFFPRSVFFKKGLF